MCSSPENWLVFKENVRLTCLVSLSFTFQYHEEALSDDALLQDDDEEEDDNEPRSWRRWRAARCPFPGCIPLEVEQQSGNFHTFSACY